MKSMAVLVAVCGLRACAAQDEEQEPPKLGEPGFVAPNPPSCVAEWADTTMDLTEFAGFVTLSTASCAQRQGWTGQTPWGNKVKYPLHDQRACAGDVLGGASLLFSSVGDLEAAAFDCFGDNQACGEMIMDSAEYLVDAAIALTKAVKDCPYTGDNPPWNSNKDLPLKGWGCWKNIWRVIQRLVKTAKSIDVAVATCELTPPEPQPAATPKPQPKPKPAPKPQSGSPAPAPLGASPGWQGLGQPPVFVPAKGAPPVERRLQALDADLPPMPSDIRQVQLALRDFLAAHGLDAAAAEAAEAPNSVLVV